MSIDRAVAKRQLENRFQRPLRDCESVAKPELGTKRQCAHCGARFFDLNRAPITCPKCGTVFEVAVVAPRGRPDAARAAVREAEAVVPETQEAEFVSLEEADAEAQGKKKTAGEPVEGDDDVEIDDESLDDAAFIEETEEEDADVTEIIGGDIENEEET
ncbi:MAG TPA: TIGR02300 family protein [Xanthobacteraceae bacterium]|nr:TIGR02300 family protein [Xanthobacteraceae bacterium]